MEKIRCVIADIPQILLADIVQQLIDKRQGFEVVSRINHTDDLPAIVEEQNIDVVVMGPECISKYGTVDKILKASPQTVAVTLMNDGRHVCICVSDIENQNLIDLIQMALN